MSKPAKKPMPRPVPKSQAPMPVAEEKKEKFSVNLKLAFILGLVACIIYGNTLKNGYTLDDYSVITENTIVKKGIAAIPEILATPYRRGNCVTTNDLYRPLSLVMFAAEYQFFGSNPMAGHLVNILLFAGCVILLFLFVDKLFERKKTAVAFIASLLFALHPIHTEIVANIKSRDELLCFFFAFLCLNLFIGYMKTGKITQLLLGFFCFLLSFLSKETVVTFLAVIPFVFFFYFNENKKRSAYITISIALATVICLYARFSVLNYYHANDSSDIDFIDNILAAHNLPFGTRLATAFVILGNYIKLLVIPYPLICDYSFHSISIVNFSDPVALLSLAVYIFLAVFGVRRFLKDRKDPYAFGIFFFLATISIFSNIPFLIGTAMGERLLFFPSVGFCLPAALLIEKVVGSNAKPGVAALKSAGVLGIIIPVSIVYAVIAINRNSDWLDNYTLYSADVQKSPNDSRLHFYLGVELQNKAAAEKDLAKQQQLRAEAISSFQNALAIHPSYSDAQAKLGESYLTDLRFDSAEYYEKKALEITPRNGVALYTLAGVYIDTKKYPQAIELLRRMLAVNPDDDNVHMRIGDAFLCNAQYDSSEVHNKRSLQLNPRNADALNNLAGVYFFNKQYQKAIQAYKNAVELRPDFVDPYANIGTCYLYLEKYDSAIYYAKKAISINMTFNSSYEILAATYKAAANMDSARKYEAIAQKKDPGFKL